MSVNEFMALKGRVEEEHQEKQFQVDDAKRKRTSRKRKREMIIQGHEGVVTTPYAGPATKVFEGLNFFIMTEALKPLKKSKADLEQLVKANGGSVVASEKDPSTILIADRNLVKVASMQKRDERNLIRPSWLYDCVKQSELDLGRPSLLLPLEPHHLFFTTTADAGKFDDNVDEFGDSYARDVTSDGLIALFNKMPTSAEDGYEATEVLEQLIENGHELDGMPGWMFSGLTAYFEAVPQQVIRVWEFAGGHLAEDTSASEVTHIVVSANSTRLKDLRNANAARHRPARVVTDTWVTESWMEKTLLDDERKCMFLATHWTPADSCLGYAP